VERVPGDVAFGYESRVQIAVEQVSRGQVDDLPRSRDRLVAIEQDGKIRSGGFGKVAHPQLRLAHRDGDDADAGGAFRQPSQSRQFLATGFAPCREEKHQDDLPAPLGQVDAFARQAGEHKIRPAFALKPAQRRFTGGGRYARDKRQRAEADDLAKVVGE